MNTIQPKYENEDRLAVCMQDGIKILKHNEIIYFEGDGRYTKIYLKNGKSIFVARLLKSFEDALSDYSFFRIHKSFLINIWSIKEFRIHKDSKIILENGVELSIARRRKSGLIKYLFSKVVLV